MAEEQRCISKRSRILAAAAVIAAFLYLLSGELRPLDAYDEGIPLVGASRVLRLESPYRDFWTLYSPAQFDVLAAVFRLFGPSLAAARVWDAVVKLLLLCAVHAVMRKGS